jgi:hypothetical protein
LFIPAYVVAAVASVVKGGHPYADNHFEVAARRSAGES